MWTSMLLAALAVDAPPAIVVVDADARAEGWVLEVAGIVLEDALPIDVVEGETVHVLGPDEVDEALRPRAGEVWEVQGAEGELVLSLIDEDVRADVVKVDGTAEAVSALAEEVGAEVVWEDGTAWLVREDVLLDLPWVQSGAALDVDAVELVDAGDEVPEPRAVQKSSTPPAQLQVSERVQVDVRTQTPAVAQAEPSPVMVDRPVVVEPMEAGPVLDAPRTADLASQDSPPTVPWNQAGVSPHEPYLCGTAQLRSRPHHLPLYVGQVQCPVGVVTLDASGRYRIGDHCAPEDTSCAGPAQRWSLNPGGVVLLMDGGEVVHRLDIDPRTGTCTLR